MAMPAVGAASAARRGFGACCMGGAGRRGSKSAGQASLIARFSWFALHGLILLILLTHECDLYKAVRGGDVGYVAVLSLIAGATLALYLALGMSSPGYADEDPLAREMAMAVDAGEGGESSAEASRLGQGRGNIAPSGVADPGAVVVDVGAAGGGGVRDGEDGEGGGPDDADGTEPLATQAVGMEAADTSGGRVCQYCYLWQPVRAKHCHECERCVLKFDHHCFWVGTCVGQRNHRLFWWYLLAETALVAWGAGECVSLFRDRPNVDLWLQVSRKNSNREGRRRHPWSYSPHACMQRAFTGMANAVALMASLVTFTFLAFLGTLLAFHSFLAATNQTTYEVTKREGVHYMRFVPDNVMPFSQGPLANTRRFCLGKDGPDSMPSREELLAISETETFWDNRYYSCC